MLLWIPVAMYNLIRVFPLPASPRKRPYPLGCEAVEESLLPGRVLGDLFVQQHKQVLAARRPLGAEGLLARHPARLR